MTLRGPAGNANQLFKFAAITFYWLFFRITICIAILHWNTCRDVSGTAHNEPRGIRYVKNVAGRCNTYVRTYFPGIRCLGRTSCLFFSVITVVYIIFWRFRRVGNFIDKMFCIERGIIGRTGTCYHRHFPYYCVDRFTRFYWHYYLNGNSHLKLNMMLYLLTWHSY